MRTSYNHIAGRSVERLAALDLRLLEGDPVARGV